MTQAGRLLSATAIALVLMLVLSGAELAGIAVWKMALAACGLAIIRAAR